LFFSFFILVKRPEEALARILKKQKQIKKLAANSWILLLKQFKTKERQKKNSDAQI